MGLYPGRYYNSVNIYQYAQGLVDTIFQYDHWKSNPLSAVNWPGQQFQVPLLLTEIGFQRPDGPNGQNDEFAVLVQQIAVPIQIYTKAHSESLLMGYCLYEFSDEPSLNANWGIFLSTKGTYSEPTGTTAVSYATWPSINYPVEKLVPVTSGGKTLIDALAAIFKS